MAKNNATSVPSGIAPLLAGICGGSASTFLLYPLDLLKVRLQVNEARKSKRTLMRTFRNVVRYEGINGLYQGLTPGLIGSAISWGGYFFIYEHLKRRLVEKKMVENDPNDTNLDMKRKQLGALENFGIAIISGAAMVLITNPIWLIKTRMQLQPSMQNTTGSVNSEIQVRQYNGMRDAFRVIIKEEGMLGLYKGSIPAMMLTSHGGVQFVSYEFLKHHFGNYTRYSRRKKLPGETNSLKERLHDSLGYLTMGALSKIIASTATYPIQVVKSRLQQRSQAMERTESGKVRVVNRHYSGVLDCMTQIWRREGGLGFFKGCLPNSLRVAPSAAITFVVYEGVMDLLAGEDHRL